MVHMCLARRLVMSEDIAVCAELGVDTAVIGCLTIDGEVDVMKTSQLLTQATGKVMNVQPAVCMSFCPACAPCGVCVWACTL